MQVVFFVSATLANIVNTINGPIKYSVCEVSVHQKITYKMSASADILMSASADILLYLRITMLG